LRLCAKAGIKREGALHEIIFSAWFDIAFVVDSAEQRFGRARGPQTTMQRSASTARRDENLSMRLQDLHGLQHDEAGICTQAGIRLLPA
jgi:hypothetical protein